MISRHEQPARSDTIEQIKKHCASPCDARLNSRLDLSRVSTHGGSLAAAAVACQSDTLSRLTGTGGVAVLHTSAVQSRALWIYDSPAPTFIN